MLEVNLLPGGKRAKAASAGPSIDFNAMFAGVKGRLGDLWSVGAISAIVIAVLAGGYLYWRSSHDRTVAESRLQKAQDDSVRYAKVVAQRNAALAKRDTLLRQVNLIRAIDDDRYIWPHIMDEVSKALPRYTWLTALTFAGTPQGSTNIVATPVPPKAKGAGPDTAKIKKPPVVETTPTRDQVLVRLTGRTADIQAMTRFMSDLEDSPFLANVLNERTTPGDPSLGGDFFQFQINVNYTRPDSIAVRRVPLISSTSIRR
jgi:Tfp pilus assembly protein PilN